jgi:hypothetical protein
VPLLFFPLCNRIKFFVDRHVYSCAPDASTADVQGQHYAIRVRARRGDVSRGAASRARQGQHQQDPGRQRRREPRDEGPDQGVQQRVWWVLCLPSLLGLC